MGLDFYFQLILTLSKFDLVMDDKSSKKGIDKKIAFIKKAAKFINKVDRKFQKWIRFKNEYRPANKRYISKPTRKAVLIRDNYSCVKCGNQKDLHMDHIIPESRNGSNELENLQVLCKDCNLRKGVS